MNEELHKDLPKLIVALDSNNDAANYIHINDVKDGINYYCPCCKGLVKPRAYNTDKEYKVQPHFYHINGNCTEEAFTHYICKTWLFEKGVLFNVCNTQYEVSSVITEKTLHTSFGDYRPDIIVTTTTGKVFYFEIRNTNKKTELYVPKWDELGNDVLEVDVRDLINNKYTSSIPEFKLIYSDGQCFIKTYTTRDYDDIIAKRKLEWKRQDKLNYKIRWEKLDWFWIELQKYLSSDDISIENILSIFSTMDPEDQEFCFNLISKHKGLKKYNNEFRKIINRTIIKYFNIVKIKQLIGIDGIEIKRIDFIEKQGVFIDYRYNSNKIKFSDTINYYSKKWAFEYSKIISKIEKFRNVLTEYLDDINDSYNGRISKELKYYKDKILSTNNIWELVYSYQTIDRIHFHIGVKNGFEYYHYTDFTIYLTNIINMSDDDLSDYIRCTIEKYMEYVYTNIKKFDGINRNYRYIFTNNI